MSHKEEKQQQLEQKEAKEKEAQRVAEEAQRMALLEEKKIAADLEQRRLAAEAAERQEIRKHEYELERLRLEARPAVEVATGLDDNVRRPQDPRLAQLSIPIFNDKAENIDDYLLCFEKLAKAHRVPETHWAVNVASFLQGSARAVYHSMPEDKADDYEKLKKALLRHYELTPEAFRKLFRGALPVITRP